MCNQIKEFLKNASYANQSIYCYGAGEYSFWITMFLKMQHININGYIVSVSNEKEEVFLGKNVITVDKMKKISDKIIIVAMAKKNHEDVRRILGANTDYCYFVTDKDIDKIIEYLSSISWYEIAKVLKIILPIEGSWGGILGYYYQQEYRKMYSVLVKDINNKEGGELEYFILRYQYRNIPRYVNVQLYALRQKWEVSDIASFLGQYKEIMIQKIYEFIPRSHKKVYILDFGANIGMSVKFFAEYYPMAQIDAYEPDPNIYDLLVKNIAGNGYNNVILHNKAVWDKDEKLIFFSEGADGGRIIKNMNKERTIEIEAIDVAGILSKYDVIDFLKIDIEGAETKVLQRADKYLSKVKNIFIEYHSIDNEKQTIHEIFDILSKNGFRVYIDSLLMSKQPFLQQRVDNGFDAQSNIFAIKVE